MTDDDKEQVREIAADQCHRLVSRLEVENDHPAITILSQFQGLLCSLAPILANRPESAFYDCSTELIAEIVLEKEFGPNWRKQRFGDPYESFDFDALDQLVDQLHEDGKITFENRSDLIIAATGLLERHRGLDLERLRRCLSVMFEKQVPFSREAVECAYDMYMSDEDAEKIAQDSIRQAIERLWGDA